LKLEKALATFDVSVEGKILLDIGASTGGFTDAALQHGAVLSYALDVGYNQLDYKLRQDERVEVMERVNFRFSKPEDFTKGKPQVASIDVSFISLKLILPPLKDILEMDGDVLVLIKPQFEAGRERIGKKGIVSDPKVHQDVLEEILEYCEQIGFSVQQLTFSPITGGSGNIEFLAHLQLHETVASSYDWKTGIQAVVKDAHQQLKNLK
jgi:ftsJ-like methyltransferase